MNQNTPKTIRENYDRLASSYTDHVFDELRHKPFDRDLLDRFAAATANRGQVCDLGCGPGHIAGHLHNAGATVFGLDLSPKMIEQARTLNPGIPFREGDMLALDLPDASLAGIAALYAIVNLPASTLPTAFQEIVRVLQPEGLLLLAFHAGDETLSPTELWGHPVSMDFFLFPPTQIEDQLKEAGLIIEESHQRDPYPEVEYQTRRAYLLARKPA
jgi:SAM-dependent methyltransferase